MFGAVLRRELLLRKKEKPYHGFSRKQADKQPPSQLSPSYAVVIASIFSV